MFCRDIAVAHHHLAGDSSDFCIDNLNAYFRLAQSDHGTFRTVIVVHIVKTYSRVPPDPRLSEDPSSDRLMETK